MPFVKVLNSSWAEMGDYLSEQYAGSGRSEIIIRLHNFESDENRKAKFHWQVATRCQINKQVHSKQLR